MIVDTYKLFQELSTIKLEDFFFCEMELHKQSNHISKEKKGITFIIKMEKEKASKRKPIEEDDSTSSKQEGDL